MDYDRVFSVRIVVLIVFFFFSMIFFAVMASLPSMDFTQKIGWLAILLFGYFSLSGFVVFFEQKTGLLANRAWTNLVLFALIWWLQLLAEIAAGEKN